MTWVSAITVFELERGVRRQERRDPAGAQPLRLWLDEDALSMVGTVIPVDERVARTAAVLHVPDPMPEMDALIAATAIVHGLTLVTRNIKDFEHTGVRLLDPWELA